MREATLQEEVTTLQELREATTEGASSYCGNLEETPGPLVRSNIRFVDEKVP